MVSSGQSHYYFSATFATNITVRVCWGRDEF